MKTPIEMLNKIIEMQEANYVNATNTHLGLSTLVREAKEVVKNCFMPHVVGQSGQLPTKEELEKRWKDLEDSELDKPLESWD